MAVSSLLILIDDIALVLDDVALMSKVAAQKTAGVLGDDLALNAQQVAGVRAERELPVVWAVAKGSVLNKVILVPAALAISAFVPWLITPLLMVGGAYLCFEGVEKLAHPFLHSDAEDEAEHTALSRAVADTGVDMVAFEQDKVKGAIRTDFVLSAEIVAITLGTVAAAPLLTQVFVLSGVSLLITGGVYGLVAAIVKMDDVGLYLSQQGGQGGLADARRAAGRMLLAAAPQMMKLLSVLGTAAMFFVGGGILMHGLPGAHELVHSLAHPLASVPAIGGLLASVAPACLDAIGGVLAGIVVLVAVSVGQKLAGLFKRS